MKTSSSSTSFLVPTKQSQFNWWYRLTAPTETLAATFAEREHNTHARLLAIVGLLLLVVILILIPATLFIPNPHALQLCIAMIILCLVSLSFNRTGKVRIACNLMVISLELAIGLVIWTTQPFDTFNLPLFDIFIIAELLAVSLLPASSVFVVLLVNTVFISMALKFQTHTPQLETILHTQYYNSLIRPIAVQLVVAVVSYVWVRLTAQATLRADQAEIILRLEQAVRLQAQKEAHQKAMLEVDIKTLVAMHNEAARGNLAATASPAYDLQTPTLFPLRTAFFLLYGRLRGAYGRENDYRKLLWAIQQVTQAIRDGHALASTHTDLDTLLLALQQQKNSTKKR